MSQSNLKQLVTVTLGVDVPAYVTRTIEVPADTNLEAHLKEIAGSLADDSVFDAEWADMGSLRVVSACDAVSGKTLVEDLGIDKRPYDRGLLASEVLKRHWSLIVQKLPCDVVGQLSEILEV